jgi:membrane protein
VTALQENPSKNSAPAETSAPGKKNTQISRKFAMSVCLLLLLAMCVFWLISNYNTQNLLRQQADSLGNTLARQTATQLTELVLANDMISMNVILGNLARNSSIAEIAVVNIDNAVIAAARSEAEVPKTIIPLPFQLNRVQAEYRAPINVADSTAGYVRLNLDVSYIETGIVNNLLFILAATLLLLIIASILITTYFQYLISFPANLLAYAISNIRKGEIETCPEPSNKNELSMAIRQFNATAEFLAQNTFLDNFGHRKPEIDPQQFTPSYGIQDVTLLSIKMANFHYLASTLSESTMVNLLNKYYFFAGKVAQLYNGKVTYCSEEEVIINFSSEQLEEEQAFYAICSGQLFLQLVGDLNDIEGEQLTAKFKLAVHSGQAVSGLYSPITQEKNNLTGKTLDAARKLCDEAPNNSMLISERCFEHAGAGTRIDAEEFSIIDDGEQMRTYRSNDPMSDNSLLIERQAIQLANLYTD